MKRTFFLFLALSSLSFSFASEKYKKSQIEAIISKVNYKWQNANPDPGNAFWHNAAYHTGNMEAYKITKNKDFLAYSEKWAEQNKWMGAQGTDKSKWKYSYGERPDYVLFGDWQTCFQTYIDLYKVKQDSVRIARAIEVMEYQVSLPNNDFWWWVDGLYMVMPVMTKMYKLTGKQIYLDKLYEYYMFAENLMKDDETGLFFRDKKYQYPKHKTINGKKDFWSRGNGWLYAGLVKVLQDMPENYKHRVVFVDQYVRMTDALIRTQQVQGYWTRSILEPTQAPGYETSGTAFFTYGMLWGINNGYLKGAKYKKAALSGWRYLNSIAFQQDGTVGYVQPIGEKAILTEELTATSTAQFGVGAFLLAASEMYRFAR